MLASDLASALHNGEIQAYYQPIANAGSRRIIAAEALVRWHRPDGTVLPPNEFVPAAERAGLSRALTTRVLGLALDQLQGWRADGHDLQVSVNTTVADLLDVNFPDEVSAALAARGLPPQVLVLEVTETSILSDPVRIAAVLARLTELGIGVALDDFGTGFSSLAHLRKLSVGEVKIDRSFVMGMSAEPADAAIVYATIELAHKLGHGVVAEGVEDDHTWDTLHALGCDRIQGYALGKPTAPAEFQRLMSDNRDDAGPDPLSLAA
jgi:EAL domain-containing protein (putative c-di-GMP-specific phosphodiesterase class I)